MISPVLNSNPFGCTPISYGKKEKTMPVTAKRGLCLTIAVTVSLVLGSLGISRVARAQSGASPQTPAELWQSWSPEARTTYVWGFLSGFERAGSAACSFYDEKMTNYMPHKAVPVEELPRHVCLKSLPQFAKPYFQTYVDSVTKYYEKYPKDRQAGIPRILLEMASSPRPTIDEIHAKIDGDSREN
jgi:hypothetical protein